MGIGGLYAIAATDGFADTLARGLWREAGEDPMVLARMSVLLPTRRAVRTLRDSFLRHFGPHRAATSRRRSRREPRCAMWIATPGARRNWPRMSNNGSLTHSPTPAGSSLVTKVPVLARPSALTVANMSTPPPAPG